jgi:hypothetical protein
MGEYERKFGYVQATEISFRVEEATEEEDYYYISLVSISRSYPDTGQESFIIDKTGTLVQRQIHKWIVLPVV